MDPSHPLKVISGHPWLDQPNSWLPAMNGTASKNVINQCSREPSNQALFLRAVCDLDKARLLAAASPPHPHWGDWLHVPPIASVHGFNAVWRSYQGSRSPQTGLQGLWTTHLPALVEKQWTPGIYMVCPAAEVAPGNSVITRWTTSCAARAIKQLQSESPLVCCCCNRVTSIRMAAHWW